MHIPEHSLTGQVAIITGAGKGLGRAYALELATLGAAVIVNNRTSNDPPGQSSADNTVAAIEQAGGKALADYSSVEAPDAGQKLVQLALDNYGRLDIVLSNAGVDQPTSFHKQPLEDFKHNMEINFHSVVRLLHAAWPHLRENGYGRVLVSTSTAGLYGNHGQSAYSSSKAALLGLTKTLAIEGRGKGICANAIAPYAVTGLTRQWFDQERLAQFSTESVARVAGWLVSEQCNLSSETIIAGAGHARLAQYQETDSVPVNLDPGLAIKTLQSLERNQTHASANDEFQSFMQSLPVAPPETPQA